MRPMSLALHSFPYARNQICMEHCVIVAIVQVRALYDVRLFERLETVSSSAGPRSWARDRLPEALPPVPLACTMAAAVKRRF
jgi:hypothetical protein